MQRPEYHTIVKILKSHATRAERDSMARWIRSSAENKVEFRKLKSIWVEYGKHHESYRVNTISNYLRLEESVSVSINRRGFIYRVAASIALLFIVGITVLELSTNASEPQLVFSSTKDGKIVELSDGSLITLRAGAKIVLDEYFNKNERNLRLIGEAFFDVKRNPSRPFHVKNNALSVEVLGTSFLVKSSVDKTEVALFSGEVEVYTDQERLKIEPNQTAVFQSTLIKKVGIDQNILSWQTKNLTFNKEKLSHVFETLENHFHVRIESSEQIEDKQLTASFEDQSLEEVLLIISKTHHIRTQKKTNNQYYLLSK